MDDFTSAIVDFRSDDGEGYRGGKIVADLAKPVPVVNNQAIGSTAAAKRSIRSRV